MLQNSISIPRDGSKSSICYEAVAILLYCALAEIYHDGSFTRVDRVRCCKTEIRRILYLTLKGENDAR
ncbi:hypothetical protein LOK49_LG13G00803 [Camellia lanceoleosa]|uniref:Uncharacterized protein n=1 Tax=Camellia lanceoleosa TaxID=1840588 RepID=A0ACC0FGD1_9ERIC|nr:hypothetical protein LOK49_LG13G00803 [Camellia lanceoleosa]